ncbi:NAD-dependent epimerase/dehydratase family protein [Anaerocolumna sp. AGMB13020]|uniref:NAD-dependent epimerase/dehydratase family protein n=1 Tax=Anaerocolumna sp. AGMB13020 TaxID=3081750 RepID=UPI0029552AC3|nr:NAD-dependent epimerase/dehydratase family protein [Anaerocolumna sp. AGMB13020]WOO37015.1 NAD-dependent epimerase/dehydratase family protein [Anaerocolumna sp. AGMB13020]
MKVLVTGAGGFLGRHLVSALQELKEVILLECYHNTEEATFRRYLSDCDFIYHLAGVNRPMKEEEFIEGNIEFTKMITEYLKKCKKNCPVLYTSSVHAQSGTPYGSSKKAAEDLLFDYENTTGGQVYIYRLPNVFGSNARPNYNSVVATFCYNISQGLPITIHDSSTRLKLCYVEDVAEEFLQLLKPKDFVQQKYYSITKEYEINLGVLAETLYSFSKGRKLEECKTELEKKLYATYSSYSCPKPVTNTHGGKDESSCD